MTNLKKNIVYTYIGSVLNLVFKFISRYYFIMLLGTEYLGLNGLLLNVIGILSLTELGIGQAINYRLFRPVANNDKIKIVAYMNLYKSIYRKIAFIVLLIGLFLIPFLPYLLKDLNNISVSQVYLYYFIYLVNTVSSYLVSYKFGLLVAQQKIYITTNFDTFFNVFISIVQVIVLFKYQSFLGYLAIQFIFQMAQRIILSKYINVKNPYLLDERYLEKISKDEKKELWIDVKGLMLHKFGEIAVYQSDNLIISAFISVFMVGVVSNYILLINSIKQLVLSVFNSILGNLGNMMVTEQKENQIKLSNLYNYIAFFLFSFLAICLYYLSSSFIELFWQTRDTLSEVVVFLLVLDFYFVGQRTTINNLKVAGGVFYQDRFLALSQAILNIVLSISLVSHLGILGVYIGTLISSLIPTIIRPIIVYRELFNYSASMYFSSQVKYVLPFLFFCSIKSFIFPFISLTGIISWLINASLLSILVFFFLVIYSIVIRDDNFKIFYKKFFEGINKHGE